MKSAKKTKTVMVKQEELDKEKAIVKTSKEMLFQNMRKNLPAYMENRLNEMSEELSNVLNEYNVQNPNGSGGFLAIQILNIIKKPNYYLGKPPKYNAEEFVVLFEYYQQLVSKINKYTKFIPTKENFCRFAGITTINFDEYASSRDLETKMVVKSIIDYLVDVSYSLAQDRKIDNITTIHRGKSTLGVVEQQAPQIVEHNIVANVDEIRANLEAIKKGQSLKSNIEIEPIKIYSAEEE